MLNNNPLLWTDGYKLHHRDQYPAGTQKVRTNETARKSRLPGINNIVNVGKEMIFEWIVEQFDEFFFNRDQDRVVEEYRFFVETYTGAPYDVSHIRALHALQYLPIEVRTLPEGALVPIGVPTTIIENTHKDFAWLVNYMETLLSCMSWGPITSATIAREYRKILETAAKKSGGDPGFIDWQGHDFSMRGMYGLMAAILSGVGHAALFTGSDTFAILPTLGKYYNAVTPIGGVPATEHSVMCASTGFYVKSRGLEWDKYGEAEKQVFIDLLKKYPTGILSVVSDTWDLWKVLVEYMRDPEIKALILARDGKLVIRPDSGDPADIVCGNPLSSNPHESKGVVELLWDVFGGTETSTGHILLDPHVGVIYGDSITRERCQDICDRLIAKGFASTNVVFGIGSYTYQYNTRDTFGFAWKATYCEVDDLKIDIFKDPITSDGEKKSAKGNIRVDLVDGVYVATDQVSEEEFQGGELTVLLRDGKFLKSTDWDTIKGTISKDLWK